MVEYHVHIRPTYQFKQVGVREKNDTSWSGAIHLRPKVSPVNAPLIWTIVHFKRLGSRYFYDLIGRCYFFFLNRYANSKTKP